jgi:hypothetical protein
MNLLALKREVGDSAVNESKREEKEWHVIHVSETDGRSIRLYKTYARRPQAKALLLPGTATNSKNPSAALES